MRKKRRVVEIVMAKMNVSEQKAWVGAGQDQLRHVYRSCMQPPNDSRSGWASLLVSINDMVTGRKL